MATAAEENRRRLAAARASVVRKQRYRPPAKPQKGNRAFARKDGEPRRA